MDDLRVLLSRAGFQPRDPTTPEAIARLQANFRVQLPDEFLQLWSLSDGMSGDGIALLSLADAEKYTGVFDSGFGYVPFTDCNDSNPYCVCCREPLRGTIVHVFHDGPPLIICHGLDRFLALVAAVRQDGGEVDRLDGDLAFGRPGRSAEDAELARKLVRAAAGIAVDESARGEALRFAAQLFGPGQEAELADLLALGDEYTRHAVLQRWAGLGTPAAMEQLHRDATAYRDFLTQLRRSFERAGVRTTDYRDGEFLLQPGGLGINFHALYADCRRPRALEEWVERLKARLG